VAVGVERVDADPGVVGAGRDLFEMAVHGLFTGDLSETS